MESVIQQWIVVVGNLGDGFEFHGPFDDEEAAADYAESGGVVSRVDTWFIASITKPLPLEVT